MILLKKLNSIIMYSMLLGVNRSMLIYILLKAKFKLKLLIKEK